MKKLITLLLALVLMVPAISLADLPDISGLSFDELVQLKEQINLAIWDTGEWQSVTVPGGIWRVGEDIPAGHWTITPSDKNVVMVSYSSEVDEKGRPSGEVNFNHALISVTHPQHEQARNFIDFDMQDGWYFVCDSTVIITPYTGKPDLGFSKEDP